MPKYVYIRDNDGVIHSYTVFDEIGDYLAIGHPATVSIIHKDRLTKSRSKNE